MGEHGFSAGCLMRAGYFYEAKNKKGFMGEKKNPHVFSIAGVDFCPSIQTQFSSFTVCFCQVWLEPLCLQPNLNEHLVFVLRTLRR